MKRLVGILIVSIALFCVAPVLAADYPAEIAVPSEAVVTVDGNPVDFCAYNLYGSNYFMLRDVAAALNGTNKQFSVRWVNNTVYFKSETAYESVGAEFSQNADSSANAVFSVPAITLNGAEITLVGYNINDSNYFKIRDIARLFDFSVEYENGTLAIDTTEQYAPEEPYDGAGIIGMAHEANLALFINEMPIVSYYTAVDAAYNETQLARINENPRLNGVYVDAKNLENYGFDVDMYEDAIWITRNKDKKFGMLDGETINSQPMRISEVYASDIKVYLDGADTQNILINGEPYISAAELLRYGVNGRTYETEKGVRIFNNRINIDFERLEYEQKLEASDPTEEKIGWQSDSPFKDIANIGTLIHGGDMAEYNLLSGLNNNLVEDYIGGAGISEKSVFRNGRGIYVYMSRSAGGAGTAAQAYTIWQRGDFEKNRFVDGVEYYSGALVIPEGTVPGYRKEGARINGYYRECAFSYISRFGYRAVREGTIENGKYVGYYREYDEDGKLIFEGDYNDWIKTKQEE